MSAARRSGRTHHDLAAAVLAGGRSRRFGRPKARAIWNGMELVDYAVDLGRRISPEPFVVHGGSEVFEDKAILAVADLEGDRGPMGGLLTALTRTHKAWLATIPCDMPLLKRSIYDLLYHNKAVDRPVVALSPSGIEPLVAIWPQNCLTAIAGSIAAGQLSLHDLIARLRGGEINMRDRLPDFQESLFFNVNYPSDLDWLADRSGEST